MKKTITALLILIALTGCGKLDVVDSAKMNQAALTSCRDLEITLAGMRAGIFAELKMGRLNEAQEGMSQYDEIRELGMETCSQLMQDSWGIIVPKTTEKKGEENE